MQEGGYLGEISVHSMSLERYPVSVMKDKKRKEAVEQAARSIFSFCAFTAFLGVLFITLYMMISGMPALFQVGLKEILLGRVWAPVGAEPEFGIFYIILTSLAGTGLALVIAVPTGILTSVFLAEAAGSPLAEIMKTAVELLACIPSVIYGLLGIYLLNPLMYKLELRLFAESGTHRFTGGANLLSAAIVLAVMILPTVINISEAAIRAVGPEIRAASLALGASRMQTVFKSVLPAAKPGIVTAVVLGMGRALGEAFAITLVSGGSVNVPLPFHSVRFLTTAIVSEMGYAQGIHRQVLFTIGLILFLFIMGANMVLTRILKRGADLCG